MKHNLNLRVATVFAAACAAVSVFALSPAFAQTGDAAEENIVIGRSGEPYTGEATVPAGKSMILRFDQPIAEVLVGDPGVADVIPLTDRSVYVLGKKNGGTNLTLFRSGKRLLGVIDLQVSYDLLNLKKRLFEMMPDERIEVRTNGHAILLSGVASDSAASNRARELAENYAPDAVVNMIQIKAPQTVMLAVRFAEVERSAAKALGINPNVLFSGADGSIGGFSSGFISPLNPLGAAASSTELSALMAALGGRATSSVTSGTTRQLFGRATFGRVTVDALLEALEERGVASILAEPTLTAISGETASFLAGGEFPVPINSSTSGETGVGRITVEFKEFGVRLAFTPTVIGDTISLIVEPEVSELDPTSSVTLNNITIPGLSTRRARTTIELKNGQSFSIAGLIQKRFVDNLNQLPGVGSMPVIGALARSARFEREDTELAIIVTPYLVEPSDPSTLKAPTDLFVRPQEVELFFLGKVEGDQPFDFIPRMSGTNAPARGTGYAASGVDGAVGYVIK